MPRKQFEAIVDRPIGYQDQYGNHYPINYGYIPNRLAGDGEEQDVYIISQQVNQPLQNFQGELVAIIHREDDVEDKWVLTSPNEQITIETIQLQTYFLEQYFTSTIELLEE
ncbi:inorganic diphosphatase [Streptococcus castoreus]|uniref:inorganic diphosphatase n=1 Tax=Streptococcus castoreus TaxID=254786 RepID=UPI0003FC885E|nr:inorganic diphosphatase [Streptococcus castoreus]